ncbi:MAG: FG-GAP-like repeat-containing protein [Pirellulaceae bacterium]|nr:FG-GAP-like repeat-containing protein [Pirellulaceae bacterium]
MSASEWTPALAQAVAEFNRGAAYLEKFEYAKAAEAFNHVLTVAPDWTAARFNRGLAYLNMAGENSPDKRLGSTQEMVDTAVATFEQILAGDPSHLPSSFCLGMLHSYLGHDDVAVSCFERVYRADPEDPFAGYCYAKVLRNLNRGEEAMPILERIIERDRGFVSAVYLLGTLYMRNRKTAEAKELMERFRALNREELAVGSFVVDDKYGMAGKYYFAMGSDGLPLPPQAVPPPGRVLFSPDPQPVGETFAAWEWPGGRVALPGIAVADVDGDGDLDLLLCGQGPQREAVLYLNDGSGQFARGASLSRDAVCPAWGDVDNDGDVDVWLGTAGIDQLWLNDGAGQFAPAAGEELGGPATLTQLTRLVDLDSDGDLDLMAMRCASGQIPAQGNSAKPTPSSLWLNHADGTFVDRAADCGLDFPTTVVAASVADDFDNDFDLDLLVFPAGGSPQAWVNFRAGQFRTDTGETIGMGVEGTVSATSGDPDKDGDRDVLVFTPAGVRLFHNRGRFTFEEDASFAAGCGRLSGTGGQFVDIDNDGDLDILIADAKRADGSRGPALLLNTWPQYGFVDASSVDPGNLLDAIHTDGDASCVAADFTGDGRCDVLLAPVGRPALLIANLTPGGHWLALDLIGKRPQDQTARSNHSAIGARAEVKTGALFQQYVVGGNSGPVASLPLRVHAGLGPHAKVDWLRVLWPDAILQGEVEVAANRVLPLEQQSRKPSSCPYLFAWDGTRFAFVADFGGVGGLGYYLGHGRYATPDPTEFLPLPALAPRAGFYELQALTPLEEITYLDEVKLIAVDHRAGTEVQPHELMAIGVAPPPIELFCLRARHYPVQARSECGADVTDAVRAPDRRYAGATQADHRFVGLAAEHAVELDFGDQLGKLATAPRTVLFLHGWVEYGYSSTNHAASQAGLRYRAPSIEVRRDGQWVAIAPEVGYPAGLNHVMTVDLTGKLQPHDRALRVTSNMEVYWDEIYLGCPDEQAVLRVQELAAREAHLHFRGYPRAYSPDGRRPNLYDYDNLDRNVAWKLMTGHYTRFGDVRPLLERADDQYVIMGHGEEVTLRFAADDFGPVPAGCTRSFLLKTDSYCKDMDLYTAFPDTVEPLPFHGMSGYPYESHEAYPDTPETRRYRAEYNTRHVHGR